MEGAMKLKMNKAKLAGVLCLAPVTFLSPIGARAENALLHKADVRVVRPDGEVIVYYMDGNWSTGGDIVVRSCGRNHSKVESRSDCKGTENRVPVEEFKNELLSEFLIGDAYKLKHMTKDEKLKELDANLAHVKGLIAQGAGNQAEQGQAAVEKLFADVRAELAKGTYDGPAVKKANNLTREFIYKKIADSKTLHKATEGKDGDQIMFGFLRQYDASKGQCGTDAILGGAKGYNPGDENKDSKEGVRRAAWLLNALVPVANAATYTVEDRIRNCISLPGAVKKTAAGVTWNLVSRSRDPKTGKFYEVWRDSQSGLLWGDRLDKKSSHYDAIALGSRCERASAHSMKCNVIKESACESEEGKRANAGIGERRFGVPTLEEYEAAEKDGIREVVRNMKYYSFWSASVYSGLPAYGSGNAHSFGGDLGHRSFGARADDLSVRCVGR
jgi:hypothetical protein